MPITRGKTRGNGSQLASYLLRQGENDSIRVLDIRGTSQLNDLRKSLLEMSLTVELSGRTKKGLDQIIINPAPAESYRMTDRDWIRAAEILEEHAGYSGQPRAMVLHERDSRIHCHCVWQRWSYEKQRILPNDFSYYKQGAARRQMEKEFGHLKTPERNLDRPTLRKLLTELWNRYDTGTEFIKALQACGHTAVWSDESHPLRLVNEWGRDFDLVREIPGVRKKEVMERLAGIPLPDKKQVIRRIRQAQRARRKEADKERAARELKEQLQRSSDKKKDRGR